MFNKAPLRGFPGTFGGPHPDTRPPRDRARRIPRSSQVVEPSQGPVQKVLCLGYALGDGASEVLQRLCCIVCRGATFSPVAGSGRLDILNCQKNLEEPLLLATIVLETRLRCIAGHQSAPRRWSGVVLHASTAVSAVYIVTRANRLPRPAPPIARCRYPL